MSINKPLAVTVGLALFATPLPSQARPGPPPQPTFTAPAKRVAQQVVYHWKKTVDSNGRVTESTPVRTLIDRFDESDFWIDLDALEDSEGQSYRMEADAWQSEGSDEVHYEIKVVRVKHTQVSDAKRAKAWAEENSGAQFDAFLADKRATAATAPPRLVDGLERWLVEAEKDETVDVVVMLDHEPAFDLPKLSSTLFSDEPAMALAQMHDRIVAIELRKNELELVQRPLVDELKRDGVRIHKQYWLINGFEAQVSAARLAALVADPRIRQIERRVAPTPDVNNLDDMREGAQIVQLHDAGFEGEDPSGMSSFNDIQIAVIDDSIDADHPAWDDWAGGPSRLLDIWRETGGVWSTVAVSATALPSHGTKVAGLALADLMQGQDPAIISVADREDRTGFAPEASFSFIESSAGVTDSIQQALSENVDIINMSVSSGYTCNLAHSTNDAVDEAMLAGIFVAKSAGSNGTPGAACNIGNPGTASGAFSVTVTSRSAVPMVTGMVGAGPSHGPDINGRAVVALAAPGGTQGATTAAFDDTYGAFGATSAATPVIAGSAAVVKEHLIDVFSSGLINEVGFLYASMLVMTDGEDATGFVGAQVPVDGTWGAGRFRARLLTAEGMDTPWRFRLISRTIDDGEFATDLLVNPDGLGVNQPLPADVDRLRAAVFWHEPNIEDAFSDWASISASICRASGGCYTSGNSSDPRQRLLLGNVAGGDTWEIHLNGFDVPISNDSNHFFGQDKRKVYVAVYYEDQDRDDANGPGADIW